MCSGNKKADSKFRKQNKTIHFNNQINNKCVISQITLLLVIMIQSLSSIHYIFILKIIIYIIDLFQFSGLYRNGID